MACAVFVFLTVSNCGSAATTPPAPHRHCTASPSGGDACRQLERTKRQLTTHTHSAQRFEKSFNVHHTQDPTDGKRLSRSSHLMLVERVGGRGG